MKTVEYVLPAYWASALVNGDYSGCEEADEADIEAWLEAHPEFCACVDVSDDSWFAHSNDATNLGGDVATYTFFMKE